MSLHPHAPEEVYYLANDIGPIEKGVISGQNGADVSVRHEYKDNHYKITSLNRRSVFTPGDVAKAASDLLPQAADGDEVLLDSAVDKLITDPLHAQELAMRLSGRALERMMEPSADIADYGFIPKSELVGDMNTRGSNIWRIADLITYADGQQDMSNDLTFGNPRDRDLAFVPPQQAQEIRDKIESENRAALDELYDRFQVSYPDATVFEKHTPEAEIRETVYPSPTNRIYFIERRLEVIDPATEKPVSHMLVTVQTKMPHFSQSDGYWPAI